MASNPDAFGSVRHGFAPDAPDRERWASSPKSSIQDDGSVRFAVDRFVEQARKTVKAEQDVLFARSKYAAAGAKSALMAGIVGSVALFFAVAVFLFGLTAILMSVLGAWIGVLLVSGGLVLISLLAMLIARRGIKSIKNAISNAGDVRT